MTCPDINNPHSLREFSEIITNKSLIKENVHMEIYQVLPVRYVYDKELNTLESSTKEEDPQLMPPNENDDENTINTMKYNPNKDTVWTF